MKHFFSRVCRALGNRLNAGARRYQYASDAPEVLRYRDCLDTVEKVIEHAHPVNVCDIGANAGHWSYVLGKLAPTLERVVMFEPQGRYQTNLDGLDLDGAEKIVYRCGVGDREEVMQIQGGSPSASLLEAARDQHHYFPGSLDDADVEEVRIRTLDSVYADDNLPYPDLIKIDVQGYELNVLKGAETVLKHARCLVIELSFREFYVGQPPLSELLAFLEQHDYVMVAHGFEWVSNQPPRELLQLDGIFLRRSMV